MTSVRAVIFAIIAMAIPLLFTILTEVLLRQTSLYKTSQLFVHAGTDESGQLVFNPQFPTRYFGDFRPSTAIQPFAIGKKADTFRIFVTGGSSTAGYPYSFGYGFPAQLELLLKKQYPHYQFEVINVGLTAVSSFTVWDINRKLHAYEPDLIVIYAGHNEYYGAMGTGSTEGGIRLHPVLKRALLRSRDFALVQWTTYLFSRTGSKSSTPAFRTTMERMIADTQIRFNGDVYNAGISQFSSNIRKVLNENSRRGVPTLLITVTSNLKDQPPMDRSDEARQVFRSAELAMGRGRDTLLARSLYLQAKELDAIRFRAPDAINREIRLLTQQFRGAVLVDADEHAAFWSESGIEDRSLFTDHLHPNVYGYARIAELLAGYVSGWVPDPGSAPGCSTPAQRESGLTTPASVYNAPGAWSGNLTRTPKLFPDLLETRLYRTNLELLFGAFPFQEPGTYDTEALFNQVLSDLKSDSSGPEGTLAADIITGRKHPGQAYREYVQTLQEGGAVPPETWYAAGVWNPFNRRLLRQGVESVLENNQALSEAEALLLLAANRDSDPQLLSLLGALYLKYNEPETAYLFLQAAHKNMPANPTVIRNLALFYAESGLTQFAESCLQKLH